MPAIIATEKLSKDYISVMEKDLARDEKKQGIYVNYKKFALVMVDDSQNLIGILEAYTAFSEIYINTLWIDSKQRQKGYGTKLIKALEKKFENQGFNNINLVTCAFQAVDFYEKCGFQKEFTRENKHHPQLTKTFFVKYFKNPHQHQGILTP